MREQQVLLEAIAAAAAVDELCLQRSQIEPDRPLEQRIEVLEGDRLRLQ